MSPSRSTRAVAAVLAFAAAVLYGSRLAPSIVLEGDSTELVSAAAVWGVPHAPGFPMLTALGHLLTALPFGSVAWRVHLASAFFHAGAVYAVSLLTGRITRSPVAAAVAGASLALSRAFFAGSLYAEVFPLNDLFFALLLLVAYDAQDAASSGADADAERARRALLQGACLLGLALAHHPMILFGVPALVVACRSALRSTLRGGVGAAGLLVASAAVPFVASYALIPLVAARHPAISTGDVHDLPSLVHLVLRTDYGGPLHATRAEPAALDVAARLIRWLGSFARSASVLPVAAALGLAARARRRASRPDAIVFGLAVLLPGPVFAAMNAQFQPADEPHAAIAERFTTMALVGLAPALGLAADELLRAAADWRGRARTALAVALAATPVLLLAPGLSGVDYSADRRGLAYARDLLRPVPDRSLVLVAGDLAGAAALYACNVERACGDRIVVAPGLLSMPWYVDELTRRYPNLRPPRSARQIHELVEAQIDSRAVFAIPGVLAKDPALAEKFDVTPALLLLRLTRPGGSEDARASALLWGQAMDDEPARCAGCRLDPATIVHPSLASPLPLEYASAMKNHAVVAREAGKNDLANRLDRRAAALVRR